MNFKEKSSKLIEELVGLIVQEIESSDKYLPENLLGNLGTIPKNSGLYFWHDRKSHKVVYVGKAVGKQGLRGRIKQHIDLKYHEKRKNNKEKEIFDKFGFNEKSVFRKAISEKYGLNPGSDTFEHLLKNYYVKWCEIDDLEMSFILHFKSDVLLNKLGV